MPPEGALHRCVTAWDAAERALLGGLAAGMVILAALQIVLRTFFRTGIPWIEPLLGIGLLWLTMLGALAATGQLKHISMDLVSHLLPRRPRAGVAAAVQVFAAIVCGRLAWAAYEFIQLQRETETSSLLGAPVWVYTWVVPVAFGLLALRFLLHAGLAAAEAARKTPPAPARAEEGGAA
ncbi:MAG: hypothetical protein BWK77_00205 [Verrucomicrobia bacterium A1]|nr:MAG: hypothetical protein BWK77_00205 [Verrucomicrobia bacterium A1]